MTKLCVRIVAILDQQLMSALLVMSLRQPTWLQLHTFLPQRMYQQPIMLTTVVLQTVALLAIVVALPIMAMALVMGLNITQQLGTKI